MANNPFLKSFTNHQYWHHTQNNNQHHLIHPQILDHYSYLNNASDIEGNLDPLTESQLRLRYDLNQFKFHVAKMNNIPVETVLPSRVLTAILENSNLSVFEIFSLYADFGNPPLGLELCKRIYDVIQLSKENFEDYIHLRPQELEKLLSEKSSVYPLDMKQVLKDISWSDGSSWLNSSKDESMFLYKKIICINKIDETAGGEYLDMMKGETIRKEDLETYVKYAEYMRNKNYDKLEDLYQEKILIKEIEKWGEFTEETESPIAQEEKTTLDNFEKFIEQEDQNNTTKSCTSLGEKIVQTHVQKPCHRLWSNEIKHEKLSEIYNIEESEEISEGQKSLEEDSIDISEKDEKKVRRCDIRPLPNSIEEIYQLAQNTKKNLYGKSIKRKQNKGKNDSEKDPGFIPDELHINNLINSLLHFD